MTLVTKFVASYKLTAKEDKGKAVLAIHIAAKDDLSTQQDN